MRERQVIINLVTSRYFVYVEIFILIILDDTLKTETAGFSEKLVTTKIHTHIPRDASLHTDKHENLRSHTVTFKNTFHILYFTV